MERDSKVRREERRRFEQRLRLESVLTCLSVGRYRLYFESRDVGYEPPHAYVERREAQRAKFSLEPLKLEWNRGFNMREIREVQSVVKENQAQLLRRYNEVLEWLRNA